MRESSNCLAHFEHKSLLGDLFYRSQALTELKVLNRYRIDNILPLYSISFDGPEACLVYQYMVNGSLEDRQVSST
jgi:serine-threonine protein kinase, plant-type, putative